MALTKLTVNHDNNEYLEVHRKKLSDWKIPFTPIGNKSMKNPECIDALDVICDFNSKELFLLKIIKDKINKDNELFLYKKSFDIGDNRKITTAMKSLINRGLVARIKREHYMVNPYFLVPKKEYQDLLLEKWHTVLNVGN